MAETVTVPHLPTVSLHPAADDAGSTKKPAKRNLDIKKRTEIKSENPNGITKPKQSESRNGMPRFSTARRHALDKLLAP